MDLVSYADLVVELVNTQDPAEDALHDLDSLRALLTPRPHLLGRLTYRDLEAMRELRQELRAIVEAAVTGEGDRAAEGLNALLIRHPVRPALSDHDGHPWHLHLAEDGSVPDRYAAGAAMGLAVLIGEKGLAALALCAAPDCRNIFFHKGSDRSQRHCSGRCAKRDGGQ
ncbi:CGNR zinc finger domain-containing protein [Actinocorallia populi]|uniref:CGNR zinc finger domain-containing protein n=1 Tax=Actinocorallia populi TaxID=2079200 RepID=UPI000D090808|nr:ABATE domain-containing protein [Actinocorallia populi]